MIKLHSKIDSTKLLHIIFDGVIDCKTKRLDVTEPQETLQVGVLRPDMNDVAKPHYHINRLGQMYQQVQESWVVMHGALKITLYDIDGSICCTTILGAGACLVTLLGGHTFECIEDNTVIYEFKTGPYQGQQQDKKIIL